MVENFIEIRLAKDEDFLKIRETLTRIGIAIFKDKKLMQSCHILHKRGKFYIVHFKELYQLDGKDTEFGDDDIARRNRIASLIAEWGLCEIVEPERFQEPMAPLYQIKIIPFRDKESWTLVPNYHIGNTPKRG